jgi:TonB family protein
MEGWVVARYTIQADGRTANVRAVDRMPPQLSDRETVAAVEAWTFEPATSNNTPIEWHNNDSVIVFDVDTIPLEPSPFVALAYGEGDNLMKSQEVDKALKRNESMLATGTSRLAEVGLAQV